MPEIEVTFRTAQLDADQEDFVLDTLDGLIATRGPVTLVTVSAAGDNPVDTAKNLAQLLREQGGIAVHFVEPDLVNATEIAARAGVSRQTVGNWSRGSRRGQQEFVSPHTIVGGNNVWRWADVNDWLAANGLVHDPVQYLTHSQEVCLNYRLAVISNAKSAAPSLSWTESGTKNAALGFYAHAATSPGRPSFRKWVGADVRLDISIEELHLGPTVTPLVAPHQELADT